MSLADKTFLGRQINLVITFGVGLQPGRRDCCREELGWDLVVIFELAKFGVGGQLDDNRSPNSN